MARTPRPAWTKRAKGPRRRHSPCSEPASGVLVEVGLAVGALEELVVAGVVVLKPVELLDVEDEDVDVDAGTVIDGEGGGSKGF